MKKVTQRMVKSVARGFLFSANFNPALKEWRIASRYHPSDSYFTDDNEDAINTMLSVYRFYRVRDMIPSIIGDINHA